MESAVALKKLIDSNNEELSLFKAYKNAISSNFNSPSEAFTQCIKDLITISDAQYDFDWLTKEAKVLEINRRDFRNLCDDVCIMLGDKLQELCIKEVITKPSKFEDYCPFSSEDIVMYTTKPVDTTRSSTIFHDGNKYNLIDCKLESTPYYNLYVTKLELI